MIESVDFGETLEERGWAQALFFPYHISMVSRMVHVYFQVLYIAWDDQPLLLFLNVMVQNDRTKLLQVVDHITNISLLTCHHPF